MKNSKTLSTKPLQPTIVIGIFAFILGFTLLILAYASLSNYALVPPTPNNAYSFLPILLPVIGAILLLPSKQLSHFITKYSGWIIAAWVVVFYLSLYCFALYSTNIPNGCRGAECISDPYPIIHSLWFGEVCSITCIYMGVAWYIVKRSMTKYAILQTTLSFIALLLPIGFILLFEYVTI